MIINNNIPALNTHRQMGINQNAMQNSMEKLSSGLRINRAGDDAAGLAISEKMRAQINGLDQASRNAQDGISMIQTAEGALQETHDILQRMRELAVQAGNDTNVEIDREEIQKEMNALSSEINRIGNTTEFNTQKILRGEGTDPEIKTDLNLPKSGLSNVPVSLEGGKFEPSEGAAVQLAFQTAAALSGSGNTIIDDTLTLKLNGQDITITYLDADANENNAFTSGDIDINDAGNEITIYLKDGTRENTISRWTEEGLKQAIEKNTDINSADYTLSRDGNAINISTVNTGAGQEIAISAGGLTANEIEAADLTASGASLGATAVTSAGENATREYAQGTVSFDLQDLKDQVLNSGISANNTDFFRSTSGDLTIAGLISHLSGTGFTIGDETIEFFDGDEGQYEGNADFAIDLNDVEWTNSDTSLAVTENTSGDLNALRDAIVNQIGSSMESVELSDTTDGGTAAGNNTIAIIAREAGSAANSIEVRDGIDLPASDIVGSTFEATFQIGANQGQGMTVEIGDMRAEALGIVGRAGDEHFAVDGAVFTSENTVTNGTDNEDYIAALDVSSHENASAAVSVLNDAIEKVSAQRSDLGAFQNRLEHTISNLDNASENLSAAESRVRDVDMAAEMMEMTRANILSQASQSMLAQANQQPQSVLQLLG